MSSKEKGLDELQSMAEKARVSDAPVYSFMSKNNLTITEGTKIYNAIQALANHKVGSAPVTSVSGKMVGVISEHDLLIQTATRDVALPMEYTKDAQAVTPETPLRDILVLLYKKKFRRIPVILKDRTIVGIVTRMDVLLKLIGKS